MGAADMTVDRPSLWLRFVMIFALLLAVAGHWCVALIVQQIPLQNYAVPANKEHIEKKKFRLKRVEVDSRSLKPEGESVDVPLPLPQIPRSPQPRPEFVADGKAVERALANNRPKLTVPAPPDPSRISDAIPAGSSPFSYSQDATVLAEAARFDVGQLQPGPNLPGDIALPPLPGGFGDSGEGTAAPLPGVETAGGAGLPSFSDLSADFEAPDDAIRADLPEPVLLRLPNDFLFEFNEDDLTDGALPLLESAKRLIMKYPAAEIFVDGHSDTIGGEAYNRELSLRRARRVEQWLRRNLTGGLYRLRARGQGESEPLVNPDGDQDEQQRNRRVEIIVHALQP